MEKLRKIPIVLLILQLSYSVVFCSYSTWISDEINYTSDLQKNRTTRNWISLTTIVSNGKIFVRDGGHFKFDFSTNNQHGISYYGSTNCISIDAGASQLVSTLRDVRFSYELDDQPEIPKFRFSDFFTARVKKYFRSDEEINQETAAFEIELGNPRNMSSLILELNFTGCSPARTIRNWNNPLSWKEGTIPNKSSEVIIPKGSGVIQLTQNVTIKSLNMSDGLLFAYYSHCQDGWSVEPGGLTGSKCYKLFEDPLPFYEAERQCNAVHGFSTLDRHLVHIRDRHELSTVKRICRGSPDSPARVNGCWIGLVDRLGTGLFDWIQPLAVGTITDIGESSSPDTGLAPGPFSSLVDGAAVDDQLFQNSLFLDWRRQEPNNHSLSLDQSPPSGPGGGELCAYLSPWQEDPLIQEQGSWNDFSCVLSKPYICQKFGETKRYGITVNQLNAIGGVLEGGILDVLIGENSGLNEANEGFNSIEAFTLTRAAKLRFSTLNGTDFNLDSERVVEVARVNLEDGSSLILDMDVFFSNNAFLGEAIVDHDLISVTTMQPEIIVSENSTLHFGDVCESDDCELQPIDVSFNGALRVNGNLEIGDNTTVRLLQGGELSQAHVHFATSTSSVSSADAEECSTSDLPAKVSLDGYAVRMSAYDSFELQLAHRGEVVGEFYNNYTQEELNFHNTYVRGVYRLAVSQIENETEFENEIEKINITSCIPYNATANDLEIFLNLLPMVAERGGVTVRRYGQGNSKRYQFGYTFRIEMDSPATSDFDKGPLTISVYCYGLTSKNCQCAETKVPLTDFRGMPQCPQNSNYSLNDPDTCVVAPRINIRRISTLSHLHTSGSGIIEVSAGVHRFPPRSAVTLGATNGIAVVAADEVEWLGLRTRGAGHVVLAGTGWDAWDSAFLLYAPEWTTKREFVKTLSKTPASNMIVQNFEISDESQFLIAAPTSNVTWDKGIWAGGILGGRATLFLKTQMCGTNELKVLRYGLTLWITESADLLWLGGDISLTDGADIIVEGNVIIDTVATGVGVNVGMSQLLENVEGLNPQQNMIIESLLQSEAGRDFSSYYGDELPSILRGSWYQNPLCGDQCLLTNHFIVREKGVLILRNNSIAQFSLPLDMVGESKLNVGIGVNLTFASGGICGNDVIIDLSPQTVLELSGGQMIMKATCTIQGEGELLVSAGSHDLSFSIDAHITISGGTMLWPLSRGTEGTISFNGGLLIQNTGKLQVEPFSTSILVKKEVFLKDESLIQFPLLGVAVQASVFDRQDAPDDSPRGNFTASGIMRWEGGTLKGKADFNALDALYLDGGKKYIQSLAKLVNKGHCEWGTGDLVSSDSGDFLNLGSLQMLNGVDDFSASSLYKGTELPVENGGDVFALEYHTYDMDYGGLNYADYLRLREQFVSRAPDGWTVETQLKEESR